MSEMLFVLLGLVLGGVSGYVLRGWWPTVAPRPPLPPCQRPHLPFVEPGLLARAKALVAQQEAEGGNGELKRHRAYARLLKEFPDTPSRQIALAIESAHEDL